MVRDAPRNGPDFCAASPFHHWEKRLRLGDLETRLNEDPETYVGKLLDLKVTAYDRSGRVETVLLRGEAPAVPAAVSASIRPASTAPAPAG